MKLITQDIHYAIKSLLYIARERDAVIPVRELVHMLRMHRAFSRRILQMLNKHKILKSLKGKGGGFALNMPPSRVRIIDIVKIFRGKVDMIDCLLNEDICPQPKRCILMRKMKVIEKELNSALESITIETLTAGT